MKKAEPKRVSEYLGFVSPQESKPGHWMAVIACLAEDEKGQQIAFVEDCETFAAEAEANTWAKARVKQLEAN
jgi:hypothetical protein